jgi:hypothetical protein
VLHISTTSALFPNRQNGSWRRHPHMGGRATLAAAPLVTVVTIPGAVFFLLDEAPRQPWKRSRRTLWLIKS